MEEDEIPCPKCKKIMTADLHNDPSWDNWVCLGCGDESYNRDDDYIKRFLK